MPDIEPVNSTASASSSLGSRTQIQPEHIARTSSVERTVRDDSISGFAIPPLDLATQEDFRKADSVFAGQRVGRTHESAPGRIAASPQQVLCQIVRRWRSLFASAHRYRHTLELRSSLGRAGIACADFIHLGSHETHQECRRLALVPFC